jgi:hypothetical protein
VDALSLRRAIRLTGGTKGNTSSIAHATRITAGAAIENGANLAPRGQGPRRSGATCVAHASISIFEHPITSSSMMVNPIPAFVWRTTASRAGQAGQIMTLSYSSSSPFTCLTWPKLGLITCPETRLIVGMISRRSS